MHTVIHMQNVCIKMRTPRGRLGENRGSYYWTHQLGGYGWWIQLHTRWEWVHVSKSIFLHILLLFSGVPGLRAVLSVCGRWDRMNR